MTSQYKQLQPEERVTISSLRLQGRGVRAIAHALGRSASTISHELRRNAMAGKGYASVPAQEVARTRRVAARRWPKLHPV